MTCSTKWISECELAVRTPEPTGIYHQTSWFTASDFPTSIPGKIDISLVNTSIETRERKKDSTFISEPGVLALVKQSAGHPALPSNESGCSASGRVSKRMTPGGQGFRRLSRGFLTSPGGRRSAGETSAAKSSRATNSRMMDEERLSKQGRDKRGVWWWAKAGKIKERVRSLSVEAPSKARKDEHFTRISTSCRCDNFGDISGEGRSTSPDNHNYGWDFHLGCGCEAALVSSDTWALLKLILRARELASAPHSRAVSQTRFQGRRHKLAPSHNLCKRTVGRWKFPEYLLPRRHAPRASGIALHHQWHDAALPHSHQHVRRERTHAVDTPRRSRRHQYRRLLSLGGNYLGTLALSHYCLTQAIYISNCIVSNEMRKPTRESR